jgi:excisionase family DNA binding protein
MATDTDTSLVHLTVAQAAQRAGVSTKTIRRWLASGRLPSGRAGLAHVIDSDELDRAMATMGQSTDTVHVPSGAPGRVPSMSIVQDLLDRLERQGQRIGQLEAELVQTRAQLALPTPQERPFLGPTDALPAELTQTPSQTLRRAPWWMPWRRASALDHAQ